MNVMTKSGGKTAAVIAVLCAIFGVFALRADVAIVEDAVLDADADWRGQGVVTIGEGATLDLNGHTLRVAAIAGAGRVVDSKSYEVLDFIEANGAQRIVTDLVPNANTAVEVVATPTDNSALTLFGTKSWSKNKAVAASWPHLTATASYSAATTTATGAAFPSPSTASA